ncbi:glycosyltransferase family 4 protein [Stappia indica]|uniref:glycosyltransferase family 4 protein n=1 Tax=Stappia indica TaxID=538381 RepID=UPI001CD40B04|nr:glycosyltransferase family 4 protein [Stappia indica]MCA1300838.1 glycosyltransferase family 4 protein [Stappia indica]
MRYKIDSALNEIESTFKGVVSTLIVSDEYPPETTGGAEISMHELVRDSSAPDRHLVIKFTGNDDIFRFYTEDSIKVIVAPKLPPYEILNNSIPKWASKLNLFGVRIGDIPLSILYAYKFGLNNLRTTYYKLLLKRRKPSGGIPADAMPENYTYRAKILSEIVSRLGISRVISNNTRSIVLTKNSITRSPDQWAGVHKIAYVRDNRFFCARHNQIMVVKDRVCTNCDFSCSHEDAPFAHHDFRMILKAVREERLSSLKAFDDIIVTSKYLHKQINNLLQSKASVHIVPNFVSGAPKQKKSPCKSENERIITIVGSINEAKGQLEFIRNSVENLRSDKRKIIHIVGRGERVSKEIAEFCHINKIENQVKMRGFLDRSNLFMAIDEADVVVLPTIWPEPFGRVPLEAGTMRTPVVAFDGGAYRETIVDGHTGYLVDRGDYAALWRKIDQILEDEQLRSQIGSSAYLYVKEKYSNLRAKEAYHLVVGKSD